ncbi:hypothetical protein AB6G21_01650 [Providencia hangzhouensis]|uniref:hypothetical protein n=1 Tax=Providencia hangzhouensis TaxID=3031799 RepID=UPI0034DDC079
MSQINAQGNIQPVALNQKWFDSHSTRWWEDFGQLESNQGVYALLGLKMSDAIKLLFLLGMKIKVLLLHINYHQRIHCNI